LDTTTGLESSGETCSGIFTVPAIPEPPPEPPLPPDTVCVDCEPPAVSCDATTSGNVQAAVDAQPPGATICVGPGTLVAESVFPKDGQTILCEGTIFDGNGAGVAFGGSGANVTIDGCTVENYDPRAIGRDLDAGAIHGDASAAWSIINVEARDNAGTGIRLGPDWQVSGCHAHHNGNLGIGGFLAHRSVIDGCEIAFNGFAGRGGEHGGHKQVGAIGSVVRNSYVHDNDGRGIWFDTDIHDVIVENNTVERNSYEGIWLENVCGPGRITGNTVTGNGHGQVSGWIDKAGIQIVNGIDIEVDGNTVGGNQHQISLLAAPYPDYGCVSDLRNVQVRNNVVTLDQGQVGAMSYQWPVDIYTAANLVFENNSYTITGGGFAWNGGIYLTLSDWQAFHPNDGL
jgi:parallel beta-helix repeat protein